MVYSSTVLKKYQAAPEEIRDYFEPCEKFIDDDDVPWDVVISYMFSRIEIAQNNTLYVGIRRKHKGEKTLARKAINEHPIYRKDFKIFFERIFGKRFPRELEQKLKHAESVRDTIMHGKNVSERAKKKAVMEILDYAAEYNAQLDKIGGFRPFGSLQGAIGASRPLEKSTTKWMLMGMGFFKPPNV